MIGKRMVMHPAWQAAHELLSDPDKWFRTVALEHHGYTEAQIATAMRCMGYGDDVIVLYEGLRVVGYELPAAWIRVNENNSLDAFPRLMALVNMPTLEDALNDPAWFVAGAELVDSGEHALPAPCYGSVEWGERVGAMSHDARQWVRRHSKATKTAFTLIILLADDAGKEGVTWRSFSMEELGELSRAQLRAQAQHNVDWLVEHGELRVQKGNGRGDKSIYTFAAIADGWRAEKGESRDTERVKVETQKGESSDSERVKVATERVKVATQKGESGDTEQPFKSSFNNNKLLKTPEQRSSSSKALAAENDDDDDLDACDLWLGDFSEKRYSIRQLRSAAWHMGNENGLLRDWAGFESWLQRTAPQKLAWMLTWLQYYGDKAPIDQERISNLAGLIVTHLKRDERAHLSPKQMHALEHFIDLANVSDGMPGMLQTITAELEAKRNGGPVPAPRQDMAWVAA